MPRPVYPSLLSLLAVLAFSGPAAISAGAAEEAPRKELSSAVSDSLGRLRALTDARDHAGALVLIDGLSSAAKPASFDAYILAQIRAQVLLAQGNYGEAVASLEKAFKLGENVSAFVDAPARLEQLYLLAQLHAQRAGELKEARAQREAYELSLGYVRRWLRETPRATAEARVFTASVLFQLGTLDAAKPDLDRVRESVAELKESLVLAVSPGVQPLTLLAAAHLQLGENLRAAEWLELLVEREPKNASAWGQLQAIYLAAAGEAEKPAEARRLSLRALDLIERARAQGLLATPKDNYTRVALLFNLQQFGLAAEQLERGLADATLENSRRNWELLASAYTQFGQEEKATEALGRAVGRFPADGALEFSLAQSLYQQGKIADAYIRAESAVTKPGLEKPGQAKVYLAYLAYELQRYADADRWIAAARAVGDVPASSIDPLARAITDALKERQSQS